MNHVSRVSLTYRAFSERLPQEDATAATESTHPNGGEVPMVLGLFATPAVCITPSSRGSDSLRHDPFALSPKKAFDNDVSKSTSALTLISIHTGQPHSNVY